MSKRVFIIHGWDGYPEEGIFSWLKKNLQNRGFEVFNPRMPDPLRPKIETWVEYLKDQVGVPDENTFFFGHSIGAQTILRYLESLPKEIKIGGAVFLAGWVNLSDNANEDEEDKKISRPWIETLINWDKVKEHTNRFIGIFSDNDPLVPFSDAKIFERDLGATIIVEHGKEHFSGSSGIKELPSALEAVLEISK